MQNKFLISLVTLFCVGCSTAPVRPIDTQDVKIPIVEPCKVDIPSVPQFNFDQLTIDSTLFDKTRALLADRQLHIAYETELIAALKACKNISEPVK